MGTCGATSADIGRTSLMKGVFTSTAGHANLPRWFASVFAITKNLRVGTLDFILPDGRVFRAQGEAPGPSGRIYVRNPALFERMVREGEMGFSEGYLDGWWDTPDLQAVLDAALLNNDNMARKFGGAQIARLMERFRHWMKGNTRRQARKNIAHHYDLGNEFYACWLDPTMTYSSALFLDSQESLEDAQGNKYAAVCESIGVGPGGHVLEIGCGWGGFAEYAAKKCGLRVTGLTISKEQCEFAKKRIFKAGLADQVDIVLRDYRDEAGRYDGIASIEMLEAVGEKYWPAYFDTVRERLSPGARATIQVITVADSLFARYRKGVDFVQKHIFPGGMLPSPSALESEVKKARLDLLHSIEFGASYSNTLRRWRRTFNARWGEIAQLGFDDRFARMWNFYLAICASCFLAETTNVRQITLMRPS
jgi:cyclopropane-fatty-acyl-phospholipid synthase